MADLTGSFKRMSGAEFFGILRTRANTGFLAVGSGFRCGCNQDTDACAIRKIFANEKIPCEIMEIHSGDGRVISSSLIRNSIACGNLREAVSMLGRPYTLDIRGLSRPAENGVYCADAAARGYVLPPPGFYNVLLYIKNSIKINNRIEIKNGTAFLPGKCDFIEFTDES